MNCNTIIHIINYCTYMPVIAKLKKFTLISKLHSLRQIQRILKKYGLNRKPLQESLLPEIELSILVCVYIEV